MIPSPVRHLCAAALVLALCANGSPPTPADQYGDLFTAVQEQRIFGDGKTFVDASPTTAPAEIMRLFATQAPKSKSELRRFVLEHFTVPGVNDNAKVALRDHVRGLWPQLTRDDSKSPEVGNSSLIRAMHPYVVPGGRFRESYYWDSYFTMLGLKADGRADLVESMLGNFTDLVERFGHIPNGTRTYYVSRSQPPFFALMVDLSEQKDPAVRARHLAALRREHAY